MEGGRVAKFELRRGFGVTGQESMDRVSESNLILLDAWDAMSRSGPGFEFQRGGLIELSWSGYPTFFFNVAVTSRPPESFEEFSSAVNATCAWAESRRVPWLFAMCHDTMGEHLPAAQRLMERLGFALMMPLTGMEGDELRPSPRPKPEGEWLTEADQAIGDVVMRLNEAAYQTPLGEPGSLALEQPGWWRAPDRMVTVLSPGGTPESCAAVLDVQGLRYVAFVATRPEAQRKGYAEAAMRDVLERSLAAGLQRRTYLHASAAGRPVYERMGYRATAEYSLYAKV